MLNPSNTQTDGVLAFLEHVHPGRRFQVLSLGRVSFKHVSTRVFKVDQAEWTDAPPLLIVRLSCSRRRTIKVRVRSSKTNISMLNEIF